MSTCLSETQNISKNKQNRPPALTRSIIKYISTEYLPLTTLWGEVIKNNEQTVSTETTETEIIIYCIISLPDIVQESSAFGRLVSEFVVQRERV